MALPDPTADTRIHVVCVNYDYDRFLTSPAELLDRYETLVEWAAALAAAGARVSVIQRFGMDAEVDRDGVLYRFVLDQAWSRGRVPVRPRRIHNAVLQLNPDIVHVNGLQFGYQASCLKTLLGSAPIILQDHANAPPRHWAYRWILRRALREVDAVSFVSREQAHPWQDGGFLHEKQAIVELMEGSSRFRPKSRSEARAHTGLIGDPVCLWVGRLNANKDPLTVLSGFAKALPEMPHARLAMVYHTAELLPLIRAWLQANPAAAGNVVLLGKIDHAALEDVYNSADLFILGSHHEGSGYAVLEAMACGVMPILTDIPSFRVLTNNGTVGRLWPVGSADHLARALVTSCSGPIPVSPDEVRAFFEKNFSWSAIAHDAVKAYRQLIQRAL
jgi:glycosyltransferase involved in cell wall biosynthesis